MGDARWPAAVEGWRRAGELRRIDGDELFVRAELQGTGPTLLLLHGFPSSSFDWRGLVAHLGHRRWVALDLLGFGLSAKPGAPNDLRRQADLVEATLAVLGVDEAQIVAHDMGTSVANELMARAIEDRLGFACDGALLFNGSMVVERASLTWEQQVLRSRAGVLLAVASNRWSLRRGLGATFSTDHPISDEELDCQWALLRHRGGHRNLHRAIAYIDQRVELAERWHGAIRDWPGRLELAWGMLDPVATTEVLAAVRALRPAAPVHELPDLGHYPQIEDPPRLARLVDATL
jgi:pimeloyl-ACP methyl ester carboxylesterase